MLRNILVRSPYVGMGGEAHFFGDEPRLRMWQDHSMRARIREIGGLATDEAASRVVEHVFSRQGENFWGRIAANADRAAFLQAVLASDRTERSFLDLALAFHASGKRIRGEKTPANLYSVPILMEWFPNAKIVHTFRDPRAVFVSQHKKYDDRRLWGPLSGLRRLGVAFDLYMSLRIMMAWLNAVRLHRAYARRYPGRYYLSSYERLVQDPQGSVAAICAFLDLDLTAEMLDARTTNSSFSPGGSGFDTSAVDRWRSILHPVLRRWFSFWCQPFFEQFGYEP